MTGFMGLGLGGLSCTGWQSKALTKVAHHLLFLEAERRRILPLCFHAGVFTPTRYPPFAEKTKKLFEKAAKRAGLPTSWAREDGLHQILDKESDGWVGIPNYTYRERSEDKTQWGSVHDELRQGRKTATSSATGLGQLLLANVEKYYPSGRAGIGDPVEEAAGMLAYIKDRYGTPANAWASYGKMGHEGY